MPPAPPPSPPPTALRQLYRTDFVYTDRLSKARYIALKYAPILGAGECGVRVLDVGCDAAPLRQLLPPGAAYTGADIRPDADVVVDLDAQDLPFADRSFDTVLCTDVLEHLERCHAVFDELCRVSACRVVVSLPNPLRNLLDALSRGRAGPLKHYGLPVDPPADRHRWFFGHEDAVNFLTQRARRRGFGIEQLDTEPGGCAPWRDPGGHDLLGFADIRAGTLWCVLRRGFDRGAP